jgi:hypothetical protein
MSTEPHALIDEEEYTAETAEETKESSTMHLIGWLSVGVAVAALGIFLGRELRSRYKFNHRTPYDFYDHVGEQPGEFGIGI